MLGYVIVKQHLPVAVRSPVASVEDKYHRSLFDLYEEVEGMSLLVGQFEGWHLLTDLYPGARLGQIVPPLSPARQSQLFRSALA
jgi:hypothetical protein